MVLHSGGQTGLSCCSHNLSLSQTHTHTLAHNTHMLTYIHTHTHTHTLAHNTHMLTYTHTHTHTRTHLHTIIFPEKKEIDEIILIMGLSLDNGSKSKS